MKSCEKRVAPESEYYVYSPGRLARENYLYPLQCGHFIYKPGYSLERESYDSFLLLYVQAGSFTLELEKQEMTVQSGQLVLIDCYSYHRYFSELGWECLWIHFDGHSARSFYQQIAACRGNVFSVAEERAAVKKMGAIYTIFRQGVPIKEALMNKYFTDILTALLLEEAGVGYERKYGETAEDTVAYMNENFAGKLTLEELAENVNMSIYHFSRVFKQETGFSPHQYLINIRMSAACYLLKHSGLPIKEICFRTGFSSESVFCSAFRRNQGMTPGEYRK